MRVQGVVACRLHLSGRGDFRAAARTGVPSVERITAARRHREASVGLAVCDGFGPGRHAAAVGVEGHRIGLRRFGRALPATGTNAVRVVMSQGRNGGVSQFGLLITAAVGKIVAAPTAHPVVGAPRGGAGGRISADKLQLVNVSQRKAEISVVLI